MRRVLSVCLVLAAVVLAVYWPVRHYEFLCFDDPEYVTDKPHVKAGLTWPSIRYALTTGVVGNWHPLTTLSHILDCQLFGVNAGPMHLVNAAFHAVNAMLLFLVLRSMTGAIWRSAIVAALFALHPLRVESVAWISERKDVLSAFFFFLTLLAYAKYALESKTQCPKLQFTHHASRFYLLSLLLFTLGLMSKPMLVTLPFVLLLLDFWPLQRLRLETQNPSLKTLVWEKTPFFALAALFSVLTLVVQSSSGCTSLNAKFTLEEKVSNALVSYVRYPGKMFWPADLAAIYPHPASHYYLRDQWPGWEICAAGLLLLAVSALCLSQLRRRPYLAVGWFWYLGMMLPVIGLIQAGEQAMADRYTYLPLIGPVMSLVWLLSERISIPAAQRALAALAVILIALCSVLTRHQLQYWRNSVALFDHTVAVTADNPGAQFALGVGLEKEGQVRQAMVHYRVAVDILPSYTEAHFNIGHLFRIQGAWQKAAEKFMTALQYQPRDLKFRLNLAGVMLEGGQTREAVQRFQDALQIDPDSTEALNNLAWIMAANCDPAIRNGPQAVEYAERACQLTQFKQTTMVGTLAAAYAEAGRFKDAVATAEKACALATQNGEQALLDTNRRLLDLYRTGQPYHEPIPEPH
jgi:protein O-mannosyl-transferase